MSRLADLRHEAASVRLRAICDLAADRAAPAADEVEVLCECLSDHRRIVQRRAAECFAALAARNVAVEGALLARLGADTWRLRWGAAYALASIGPVPLEALETLLEGLGSADADLRWAALELLGKLVATHRAVVVERLTAALSDPGVERRKMALYALGRSGPHGGGRQLALIAALGDEHPGVRRAALSTVARTSTDRRTAGLALAARLADPDHGVRRAAAAALGSLGDRSPEVLEVLRRAAASDDPSLCRAAARSLTLLRASAEAG